MTLYLNGTGGPLGRRLARILQPLRPTVLSSRNGAGTMFCDLADASSFARLRADPDDLLVFPAAISKPDACAADPGLARTVNVDNTAALIRRFTNAGARVLFFSSDTVYGNQEGRLSEDAPLLGAEPYGAMKREIEEVFAEEPRFKALRLSYVVHEDDDFARYLRHCARAGETAVVFAGYSRNMVCIDDVMETVEKAVSNWRSLPKALNVGGPECLSRARVAALYREGPLPDLEYREEEPPESFFRVRPRRIEMNVEKLRRFLGRDPAPFGVRLGAAPKMP